MSFVVGSQVRIVATNAKGTVGYISHLGQCRVDLPDNRWGWHFAAELQSSPFDAGVETMRIANGMRVARLAARVEASR